MNKEIQLFEGQEVKVKTDEGTTLINLVHVAKCCGLTREQNGYLKIRWTNKGVTEKLNLIKSTDVDKKILEEITYILDEIENTDDRNSIYMSSWLSKRLAIECHSEKANRFKNWLVSLDEARENGVFERIKDTNINMISDRLAFMITLLTNLPNDEYKNITVSKVLDFISLNNHIQSKNLNNIKFLLNEFLQLPDVIVKETENGIAVDAVKFFTFFNKYGYSKYQILSELDNSNLIYHPSQLRTVQVRVGNGDRVRAVIIK